MRQGAAPAVARPDALAGDVELSVPLVHRFGIVSKERRPGQCRLRQKEDADCEKAYDKRHFNTVAMVIVRGQ